MDISLFGFIILIILGFLVKGLINRWLRILDKLSAKAEEWVDSLEVNKD